MSTDTYGPWGKVVSQSGSYSSVFGYAGMFRDTSDNLNLTLYRAYNPLQGRWLSRDPMGEDVDYNLYRYVLDNPENMFDALGLFGSFGQMASQFAGGMSLSPASFAARKANRMRNSTLCKYLEFRYSFAHRQFPGYFGKFQRNFDPARSLFEGARAIAYESTKEAGMVAGEIAVHKLENRVERRLATRIATQGAGDLLGIGDIAEGSAFAMDLGSAYWALFDPVSSNADMSGCSCDK